ncbi:MAG: biotin synthase [Chlamydiales bacterium]|jgi:biotin synthase
MPSAPTQTKPARLDAVEALFATPLLELVFQAATRHREHHAPDKIQCSQLLSIKTGGCPEDCGYCSQSAHFDTGLEKQKTLQVDEVLTAARDAKAGGADRFCMGAAWREVKDGPEFDRVLEMVKGVKDMGLETCVTLGMLAPDQATRLRDSGLDYYNHNLDSARSFYKDVVHTRAYDDRIDTLRHVREAGISVCSGGILGLGETVKQRAELLHELASLEPQPESVPINTLVPIAGTPMEANEPIEWSELVRTIAATRLMIPKAVIRLSAGRGELTEEAQALCFLAGANSIFVGDQLLTTPNPEPGSDSALFQKLGLTPLQRQ